MGGGVEGAICGCSHSCGNAVHQRGRAGGASFGGGGGDALHCDHVEGDLRLHSSCKPERGLGDVLRVAPLHRHGHCCGGRIRIALRMHGGSQGRDDRHFDRRIRHEPSRHLCVEAGGRGVRQCGRGDWERHRQQQRECVPRPRLAVAACVSVLLIQGGEVYGGGRRQGRIQRGTF